MKLGCRVPEVISSNHPPKDMEMHGGQSNYSDQY